MKGNLRTISIIILVLLIAIFTLLNVTQVPINLGWTVVHLPMALILVISVLLGALLDFIIAATSLFKAKRAAKRYRSKLLSLQHPTTHKA